MFFYSSPIPTYMDKLIFVFNLWYPWLSILYPFSYNSYLQSRYFGGCRIKRFIEIKLGICCPCLRWLLQHLCDQASDRSTLFEHDLVREAPIADSSERSLYFFQRYRLEHVSPTLLCRCSFNENKKVFIDFWKTI